MNLKHLSPLSTRAVAPLLLLLLVVLPLPVSSAAADSLKSDLPTEMTSALTVESALDGPALATGPRNAQGLFSPDAPSQLNAPGFAYCLAQDAPQVDLGGMRADFALGDFDLLLLYLSVYPGKRIPGLAETFQTPAHDRWARAFERPEKSLAETLRARVARGDPPGSLAPGPFFKDALEACGGSPFCAALISHNVIRTLGRHAEAIYRSPLSGRAEDLNPDWYRSEEALWLLEIPQIQALFTSLRIDGGGDRYGEWYHFFGILTFSIHEMALHQKMRNMDLIVRLGEILNPLLAAGAEVPEKAALDRDSVEIAWLFIRNDRLAAPAASCTDRAAYVRPANPGA
jgi:hypothetical protein